MTGICQCLSCRINRAILREAAISEAGRDEIDGDDEVMVEPYEVLDAMATTLIGMSCGVRASDLEAWWHMILDQRAGMLDPRAFEMPAIQGRG